MKAILKSNYLPTVFIVLTAIIGIGFSNISPTHQPKTLKLIPMMRVLLSDVNTIDTGIYTEDYSKIREGAKGISDHPAMTQHDKALIKKTLGGNFSQFVKLDMTVHHHADSIAAAAEAQNMNEVLHHYRIVQSGCVSCHSHFRKQIINAENSN